MNKTLKIQLFPIKSGINTLIAVVLIFSVLTGFIPLLVLKGQRANADLTKALEQSKVATFQNNTLIPVSGLPELKVAKRITVIATGYSSTVWETDDDPFITAAGTEVRKGVVANNLFSFGTKVRIPELYGDRIFVVEDRMNSRKGYYQIDIWFPSYWEAKNFGAKKTYIEILES